MTQLGQVTGQIFTDEELDAFATADIAKIRHILCGCNCGARILMRDYQITWAHENFERGKQQYLDPIGKCEWGCKEKCLHGWAVFLGWEQRVGKTPAFLYYLHLIRQFLKSQQDPRWMLPILIIALAKNEQDIVNQTKIYMPGQPTMKVVKLEGDASELREIRQAIEGFSRQSPEIGAEIIFVTHYDAFGHQGATPFVMEINKMKFLFMVCDQSERAQNDAATRSKVVIGIDREVTIMVSGEPSSNPTRGDYLYGELQIEQPGPYKYDEYHIPSDSCKIDMRVRATALAYGCQTCYFFKANRCVKGWDEKNPPKYRERLPSPCWPEEESTFLEHWYSPVHQHALHRKLVEVAHLSRLTRKDLGFPDVELEVVEVTPTKAQQENYEKFLDGIVTIVTADIHEKEVRGINVEETRADMNTLNLTQWLTMAIQMSPRMMYERSSGLMNFKRKVLESGGKPITLDMFDKESAKVDKVIELFKAIPPHDKMIVFSHYIGFLQEVRERLDVMKTRYCYLDGPTQGKKIDSAIANFSSPYYRIFLASDAAVAGIPMQGGLGEGDTMWMIFPGFPYWNPGTMNEAGSRAFEMSMKNKVRHISLVGMVHGHSIDRDSAKRLLMKQSIADRIHDGEKVKSNMYDYVNLGDFMNLLRKWRGNGTRN